MRFIYTKTFAVFFACLVLVAILSFLQYKGFLDSVKKVMMQAPRPVVYVARGITRPVQGFFSTLFQLRKISRENDRLRLEIGKLEEQLVTLDQSTRENEALRKELGFVKNASAALEACTVLAQNPVDLTDTVVLDCGTESGVAEGQAIVSEGYLAGKIIYSGDGVSTALLATNSKFSTDAKLSTSGVEAVVRGSFGAGLTLDQLSQNAEVQKDWLVVTAGINQKIPKNILIGRINEILSGENDLFKRATLVSPVNFKDLEFVFVVKP